MVIVLMTLAFAALGSCDLQPKAAGVARPRESVAAVAMGINEGPFAPASINLHPLTRFTTGGAGATGGAGSGAPLQLDAYVELLDPWGDGVKALGSILFELYRAGDGGEEQLARWSENLSDLEVNAQRYDRVTRCYRFKLDLAETGLAPGARESYELRARFTTLGGRTLSATRVPATAR